MIEMNDPTQLLWVERFRPKTIATTILPQELKKIFQTFVDNQNVPNLLLSGKSGMGKTTVARAMLEEIGSDYIIINGSMNGNIDTLRNDIANFASSVSFAGGRKYIILDEADFLNPSSFQPAMRNFMEEYSNLKNRIIDALHSRCSVIDFAIPNAEKPKLASHFFKRALEILDLENVKYNKQTVVDVIQKFFPDWRRVLNEMQKYSATGAIDEGILLNVSANNIDNLLKLLKEKKFTDVRRWVGENSDLDSATLYRYIYDVLPTKVESTSTVADVILILAEFEYKESFCSNSEINRMAALTTIMAEVSDWK
jgi:DNA polymerase III delta prime subunit